MDRIVLDTNSLLMCISPRSKYRIVWNAFLNGSYTLCITNDIIEEYYEVMARNLNQNVAEAITQVIINRSNVIRLDPHIHFHLITADEDDNKFVDCAIVANAKCIVTEDHHFDILQNIKFPHVHIMGIEEFSRTLLLSK